MNQRNISQPQNPETTTGRLIRAAGAHPAGKHCRTKIIDNSCVMCGSKYINSGRILHGHCVCEECVSYILHDAETSGGRIPAETDTPVPKRPPLSK